MGLLTLTSDFCVLDCKQFVSLCCSSDRTMQEIVYKLVPGLQERKCCRTMSILGYTSSTWLLMEPREKCVGNLETLEIKL